MKRPASPPRPYCADCAERGVRRRPWRAAVPALAVGAAAAVAAFVAFGSEAAVTVEPNSVAVIDPATNEIIEGIRLGVEPEAVAVGPNAVWVANKGDAYDPQAFATRLETARSATVAAYAA